MPRVARPWAPASVRKQWLMPHSLIGSCSASSICPAYKPPSVISAVATRLRSGVLDAVDLRFRTARNEADPLEDLVAGQVGRDHRREALRHQHFQGVPLQRQFQQHGFVLQEVESVPGRARPAFEIDQVQLLAQAPRGPAAGSRTCAVRAGRGAIRGSRVVRAHRRVGMRHVGNRQLDRRDLGVQPVVLGLGRILLLPQLPAFFLAGFALRGLLAWPIVLVTSLAWRLSSWTSQQTAPPVSNSTSRSTSALASRFRQLVFDQFGVFDDEFAIEHGSVLCPASSCHR